MNGAAQLCEGISREGLLIIAKHARDTMPKQPDVACCMCYPDGRELVDSKWVCARHEAVMMLQNQYRTSNDGSEAREPRRLKPLLADSQEDKR